MGFVYYMSGRTHLFCVAGRLCKMTDPKFIPSTYTLEYCDKILQADPKGVKRLICLAHGLGKRLKGVGDGD